MAENQCQTRKQKNEIFESSVLDLTYEGLGLVKMSDGFPVFVENALVGERVKVRLTKIKKNFAFGRVEEFLSQSPERVSAANLDYLRTGIADLAHLDYAAQLKFKEKQVLTSLTKASVQSHFSFLPILAAENNVHYRNKAQIPVRQVNGQLETGFFRKNSHDLLPIEDFYIQQPEIDDLVFFLRELFRAEKLSAYDEQTKRGLLRNIVVRRGYHTGEMMLVIVASKAFLTTEIVQEVLAHFPALKSIRLNINQSTGNAIFGQKWQLLYGKKTIQDSMLGKIFEIGAQSFYQINTAQAEKLYQVAYDFAQLTPQDIVIDAYSGIGTIGLCLADKVKAVYGMEVIAQAVENAQENARLNHVTNSHYEVGPAEVVLPAWLKKAIKADVIFVDPPRKGLDEKFIQAATSCAPRAIVYVSCNPATFARDVARFEELGYSLEKAQPVDLFPQTHHVECVGLLTHAKTH